MLMVSDMGISLGTWIEDGFHQSVAQQLIARRNTFFDQPSWYRPEPERLQPTRQQHVVVYRLWTGEV